MRVIENNIIKENRNKLDLHVCCFLLFFIFFFFKMVAEYFSHYPLAFDKSISHTISGFRNPYLGYLFIFWLLVDL